LQLKASFKSDNVQSNEKGLSMTGRRLIKSIDHVLTQCLFGKTKPPMAEKRKRHIRQNNS